MTLHAIHPHGMCWGSDRNYAFDQRFTYERLLVSFARRGHPDPAEEPQCQWVGTDWRFRSK